MNRLLAHTSTLTSCSIKSIRYSSMMYSMMEEFWCKMLGLPLLSSHSRGESTFDQIEQNRGNDNTGACSTDIFYWVQL